MGNEVVKRNQIPSSKKWAIEDIFSSVALWESAYSELEEKIQKIARYKGHLGESPETLKQFLDEQSELECELERLYIYAHLNHDVDTTDSDGQAMYLRAQMLYNKYIETESFSKPEIMEIPKERLEEYRKADGYKVYDRFFLSLERERDHTRNKEIEEILASAEEMAQNVSTVYTMFNNADIKFGKIKDAKGEETEVTHGRYIALLESSDRQVRKNAFEAMNKSFGQFTNTVAANYSGKIKQAVFFAKARKYSSTRAMYLAGSHIPEQVYDNLIQVVHESLPAMYQYVELRKKALKLEELHLYDVYVPIVQNCNAEVSFEEAKDTILKALQPMGETYLQAVKECFENRWIDAEENAGKRSGAYCSGGYLTHPYILMTYKNTMDSMFTLIHELGHSMHSYFSNKNQPPQTAGYTIFVAEVASICNEMLLTRYLLEHTEDKDKKAYVINHFLDSVKGTLFRQTMFAEFEMKAHRMQEQGEALTAETLNEMYYKLNALYFGPEMTIDSEIQYEWERIPHFYSPFYVYQYATGLAAAIALSEKILRSPEQGVADYMQFLSSGGAKDPIQLLKLAGVDMEKSEPVEATVAVFREMLNELQELQELKD